jgi:hypothetical protein
MAAAVGAGAGYALWFALSRIVPESTGVADIVWRVVLVAVPMAVVAGIYLPWVARLCPAEMAMIRNAVRSRLPGRG